MSTTSWANTTFDDHWRASIRSRYRYCPLDPPVTCHGPSASEQMPPTRVTPGMAGYNDRAEIPCSIASARPMVLKVDPGWRPRPPELVARLNSSFSKSVPPSIAITRPC